MKRIIFGLAVLVGVLVVLTVALPTTGPSLVLATSSGPNNGGAFANDNTVGTIDWSNPLSANISDDQPATVNLGANEVSHYLKASGFGFSIPAGATINGIQVDVERNGGNSNRISDNSVRLVKNGTISGANKSAAETWPASDGNITYGGSNDLWGLNWTSSDINSVNFGFVISAKHDSNSATRTASVDCIRITVYYTILAATASSNSPVCEGATIDLYGGPNGMASYNWTGPGGWTNSTQNATRPNATLAMGGNYTLTVTDSSNSTATNTTSVTVNAKPAATASSNSPVCEGSTIVLTGGPGGMASYNWTGPGGWTSSLQNPTRTGATTNMTGTYTLTVTNGSGCTATNSTSVTVNAKPTPSASSNSPVSEGATIELYGGPSGMASYSWTGPGGWTGGAQNATRPNATTNMTGTYTLTVTNSNGCTATNSISVTVTGAQSHAWPANWTLFDTDNNETGCDTFRNVVAVYYASDSQYLHFRMETVTAPGWPSAAQGGKSRYKWWFNTAGTPAYIQGNKVYQAEFLLMLEDLNDNSNDPNDSRDQLGELTLLDDLNNAGFDTRWDSANPPHYTTNNAQTPPTGNSSWWRRLLGTGTPGAEGPQGVMGADIGYRIDDNTTGGHFVDTYVSWAALGNPSSLCMIWSTDNQDPNIDQAPNCDSPAQVSCITLCIPPNADFHASSNTTCVNGTITFIDDSTWSPTSWNWTFGDGGTSTAQNATHSYASAGTYNVTLTVSNACGNDTETKTNYITVYAQPAATASSNSPVCEGATIELYGGPSGMSTYNWTGPGGFTSSAQNATIPNATTNMTGTYTLTATNGSDCTATNSTSVTVNAMPAANFSANVTSGCAPLTVQFTDTSTGSPTTWSWNFGGGSNSTLQSPSHQYTSAGTYNVSLTVSNACGSNTTTQANYITITTAPTANFSANVTSGCAPLTVQFTDTSTGSPTTWSWNFTGGNPSSANTTGPHTVTYNTPGTYNVTLTVSNTCGSNTTTQANYVTVGSGAPVAAFNATPTSGCAPLTVNFTDQSTGNPTNWSWSFPGGNPSSANTTGPHAVTYNTPGTYNVTLTVSNTCGSNTTTQANYITVGSGAPVAAFSATPTSGCAPLTVNFTDQSTGNPSSWNWIFGDGDTSTDQNPSHQYANVGTYNVTLTVSNACGNNTETQTNYITANDCVRPSLNINKTDSPDPVEPGGTLTYTITVTNTGSANATGVTVADDYDETILTITDPDGGDDDGHTITWDEDNPASWDGTIPAGDSVSFTVIAQVASPLSDGTEVVNNVFVTCTEDVQANKQISTVVKVSPPVGGDAYPINKVGLIAPWIALILTIIGGSIFLARRRYHILE